jgi:ABC-type antimicrobial peptide transport system permease subunit
MGKLFNVFSVLAIFISCLGLFGLSAYTTQRRIKEIGVRKVLGAGVQGIVGLLAREFLVPVALVALCTVSYQSLRAARANPLRALRSE